MKDRAATRFAVHLFGAMQRLLPLEYRRRSGRESLETFESMVRESYDTDGATGVVRALVLSLLDLARRLPTEHRSARAERRIERQRSGSGGGMKSPREWFGSLSEDVRCALRKSRREPGFVAFAALIIGIGVGANTAVFSVMSPLLIRPLPFRDPDRLVWVSKPGTGGLSSVTSRTSNLRDYRELSRTFDALTGYFAFFDYSSYTMTGRGEPERLVGVGIAQDFLDVLGVDLKVGRGFTDEEAVWNGRAAVILTHDFWERRFDADPSIVGQTVTLNESPTEIVGVLPSTFDFASTFTPASHVDFLTPFPIADETDRWGNTLAIIGRLRPGVTVAAAQADLDRVTTLLQQADANRWGLGASVTSLREHIAGSHRSAMLLLVAAACGVMLVACANLSNLLLARGRSRGKEMAVRSALGADRRRLLRQLTIESLMLAAAGGLTGVGMAWGITKAVTRSSAVSIPLLRTVSVDPFVLVFALVVTLAAGLLVGLAPIVQVLAGREANAMRESARGSTEGRRGTSLREFLVVSEVAAACVLLVGSGLLLRSFVSVLTVDLGFQPAGVVAWRVDTTRQFESVPSAVSFYDRMTESIRALPGVESAGLTDTPPLGRNREWGLRVQGVTYADGESPSAFPRLVGAGYLEAMRIRLLSGRYLTMFDDAGSAAVIVINQSAAESLFPGQDAVGRTVLINSREAEVVGVVEDVRHQSVEAASGNEMYLPYAQVPGGPGAMTMVVRSALPLPTLARNVKGVLADADPTLATGDFEPFDAVVDRSISPRRFVLRILVGFAGTALLLAALGIYAVLSYSVTQRVPEIGIRMALGESVWRVRWSVVSRMLVLAVTGVAVGAILSFALTRLLRSMLFGTQPADPITFLGVSALLVLVAAIAGFLPARRASSTDPMVALRTS